MGTNRVIIADESHILMEGIRSLLETVFESVVMVADVRSLKDVAGKIGADMAVVDLTIGGNDLKETIEDIKERFPDLKVLVMSTYDEEAALKMAVAAGAEGYILKQLAATDLIPAVIAILGGGTFASKLQNS
jgi:DNA-binding NarL/FixJ family response regulator